MKKGYSSKKEFFASANGYSGFKSYFSSVFDSHGFDRIFVLKGGPGSGKSTLMKKIYDNFKDENLNFELFRCSSDKNSIDGIIFENDVKRVAIVDGTAPHERDAIIPGAVDILVNLGDSFDNEFLSCAKNDIFELNLQKKNSYQKSYYNLAKSSVFDNNIKAELKSAIDYDAVSVSIKEVIKTLNFQSDKTHGVRLISSFSKDGYEQNDSLIHSDTQVYSVFGEHGSEHIFMSALKDELKALKIKFTEIPSPLNEKSTEGIYFKDSNTAIIAGSEKSSICDSSNFIRIDNECEFRDKISALNECKRIYETEAANALMEASKYHFDLEKIYTQAVNFDIINGYTDNISEKISKIFK